MGASGESALKEAKNVLSGGKVIATVFWDSQGLITWRRVKLYRSALCNTIGPFES